jgi:hypothetical protein
MTWSASLGEVAKGPLPAGDTESPNHSTKTRTAEVHT